MLKLFRRVGAGINPEAEVSSFRAICSCKIRASPIRDRGALRLGQVLGVVVIV